MATTEPSTTPAPAAADQAVPVATADAPAQLWAVVELMGHHRIAGAISQQLFGGAALVRVDVPAVAATDIRHRNGGEAEVRRTIRAHSRGFTAAAIFSIHWCDEVTATVAAHHIRHEPLRSYSARGAMACLAGLPVHEQQRLMALWAASTTALEGYDDDDGYGF